ncbi:MAG: NADH-quinone oxidoreductase subunit J [Syntrophothermus sp.]|nr:NADH-quinone oxidoreductase subunit J [Ignavibacteriaceae bacterium]
MTLEFILFFIFALVCAVSSILVITRATPVFSALFLVLNFASLAGLYLLLNAQFIAVSQVIVYAGAIMVLFLFVIMLLRPEADKASTGLEKRRKILSWAIGGVVFLQLIYILFIHKSNAVTASQEASVKAGTVESIGQQLFTNYILPFEAAGFLLLGAAIGALVLAKKKFE